MNGDTEVMEPVAVPVARGQAPSPCKSPWYGTYVRRLSVSKEAGKGMNVMDLYPYSNPGNIFTSLTRKIHFKIAR
jgi:hypothetical protein